MYLRYLIIALFISCLTPHQLLLSQKNTSSPIKDLITINQNHLSYLTKKNSNKTLISKQSQKKHYQRFLKKYFSPWNISKKNQKKPPTLFLQNLHKNPYFKENKQKITHHQIKAITNNINSNEYPNYQKKAITIVNTNIRKLPTNKPLFEKFSDNSNGFPFDILQNTALPANTPIYIKHITKDNAWVYIQTALASGWVSIQDIAYTNKKFIKKFTSYTSHICITTDNISLFSTDHTYLYKTYIGMTYPLISKTKRNYKILIARVGKKRKAYLDVARISKLNAAKAPLIMTTKNIATLSNKLINQPYGWGGLFNNRDCSSMIRDLFSPFGIWLPRNSKSQAKSLGNYTKIAHLSDFKKEKYILNNAIAYKTLLWLPGHIMLYIGKKNNKALVFHNIWGLRSIDEMKRIIIGKAVITTLKPGSEINHIDKSFNFLNQVQTISIIK
jgi:cell wall-associated NlpC family hydrolase